MSRKFKITIACAWWGGSDTLKFLYVGRSGRGRLGHVSRCRAGWECFPYGHSVAKRKTLASAKAYVIKQLATPKARDEK